MARQTRRLSARTVATIGKPGMHADGDGLYLKVDKSGAKRWAFIFFRPDPADPTSTKRTEMGLGRLDDVSLAEAREKVVDARRLVAAGQNPIEVRRAAVAARAKPMPTFGEMADAYVEAFKTGFRNEKHIWQWSQTLGDAYCAELRTRRVDQITTEHVLAVLQPIWLTKGETAARLRGRIEKVLDYAKLLKHRDGPNPALWRGTLDAALPKRQKLSRGHHAAMPYSEVPALMERLRKTTSVGATALRFTILTASRTGEAIGARAEEFDLPKSLWVVPGERTKSGREHRVPLTAEALDIVEAQIEVATSSFIFSGAKPRRPISNMTMSKALTAAGAGQFTVHGMRSAFRDWVGDETSFPGDLAEAALAHVSGDETERAYRRGDALAKRRKLMSAWANFCSAADEGKVVPLRRSQST